MGVLHADLEVRDAPVAGGPVDEPVLHGRQRHLVARAQVERAAAHLHTVLLGERHPVADVEGVQVHAEATFPGGAQNTENRN